MFNELIWRIIRKDSQQKRLDIEEFCHGQGFPSFLGVVSENNLPNFSSEIERHIRQKAREDLPKGQFEYGFKRLNLDELLETGGVIGYSDHLNDLASVNPKNTKLFKIEGRFAVKNEFNLYAEISANTTIIHWHTHPGDLDWVSKMDVVSFMEFESQFRNQGLLGESYYLLYIPLKDKFIWHRMQDFND